jgi:CRISPR-associated protein Cmr2
MKYLLAISISPVQDFIAASRKTADLFAGSRILCELAQTIAQDLNHNGATLIFPPTPQSDGPNKILVMLEEKELRTPAEYAESAKNAAKKAFSAKWDTEFGKLKSDQKADIDEKRAKLQVETFLEVSCVWVPIGPEGYLAAKKRVDGLLIGRKTLNEFASTDQQDSKVPKSPLDPARASVVMNTDSEKPLAKHLNLKATEYLDAISLIKRIRGRATTHDSEGKLTDVTHLKNSK